MNPINKTPRAIALFLTVTLFLPNPAMGLRNQEPAETPRVLSPLSGALTRSAGNTSSSSSGLEEGGNRTVWQRRMEEALTMLTGVYAETPLRMVQLGIAGMTDPHSAAMEALNFARGDLRARWREGSSKVNSKLFEERLKSLEVALAEVYWNQNGSSVDLPAVKSEFQKLWLSPSGLEEFDQDDYGFLLDQAPGIRRMSRYEQMVMGPQSHRTAGDRYVSEDGLVEIIRMGEGLTIQLNDYSGDSALNIQEGYLPIQPPQRVLLIESLHPSGTNQLFEWRDQDKGIPLIQKIEYHTEGDNRVLTLTLDPRVENIRPGQPEEFPYPAYPIVRGAPFKPETVLIRLQREGNGLLSAPAPAAEEAPEGPAQSGLEEGPTQEFVDQLAQRWARTRRDPAGRFAPTFSEALRASVSPQHREEAKRIAYEIGIPSEAIPRNFTRRTAGMLVPMHSLPGGIADLELLIDWAAGQGLSWLQFLPIQESFPDDPSPYNGLSAFAAHPLPIVLERVTEVQASADALKALQAHGPRLAAQVRQSGQRNHREEMDLLMRVLQFAFEDFQVRELRQGVSSERVKAFRDFQERNAYWLIDYSAFRALIATEQYRGGWTTFPPDVRDRQPGAVEKLLASDTKLADSALFYQYVQFVFDEQWSAMRRRAHEKGISLLGDIPIYVAPNSDAVWANQKSFDQAWRTGCPPDMYAKIGQYWGHYPYDWDALKSNGYALWMNRLRRISDLFDGERIDHVRAMYDYYRIPPQANEAKWLGPDGVQTPVDQLLTSLAKAWHNKVWVAEATPQVRGLPFPIAVVRDRTAAPAGLPSNRQGWIGKDLATAGDQVYMISSGIPYAGLDPQDKQMIQLVMQMLDADWTKGPSDDFMQRMVSAVTMDRLGFVLGEDLGLMSDGVRPLLQRSGVPGMVPMIYGFYFDESDRRVKFFDPYWQTQKPNTNSFILTTNHDTETLTGRLQDWASKYPEALPQLAEILKREGFLPGTFDVSRAAPGQLVAPLHFALMWRTASSSDQYFFFSYQDIFRSTRRTNVPGTVDSALWADVMPVSPRALLGLDNEGPAAREANKLLAGLLSASGVNRRPAPVVLKDKPAILGMMPQTGNQEGVRTEQVRKPGEMIQAWAVVAPAKNQTAEGAEPQVQLILRAEGKGRETEQGVLMRLYSVLPDGSFLYYAQTPAKQMGRFTLNTRVLVSGDGAQADWSWAAAPVSNDEPRLRVESAGLEEVFIPLPYAPNTAPATAIWSEGWDVFPSVKERFHRMAVMAAPGGPVQFLRVFTSLKAGPLPPQLLEETFNGRRLIDHLKMEGMESGYLRAKEVHPYVGWRIAQILAAKEPKVRARIHLTPGDLAGDMAIPMEPINLWLDGAIRYEGLVPAEPQFEGEHSFSIEVLWNGKWSRINGAGWIRVDPPNPAQIAAQASAGERQIGEQDSLDELRFARGYAQELEAGISQITDESQRLEIAEAIRLVREKGVVTDLVLPADQRAPLLRRLVNEKKLTPGQARRAYIAQQQAAGLQRGFFVGMQFKLGVLPGNQRVQIMFNPNRANTPKPPSPKPGEKSGHPLADTKPLKLVLDGQQMILPQRSLPVFSSGLGNWLKSKVNPFGYVFGHSTLPTDRQEQQQGWSEAVQATVEEMWQQEERMAVIAGNIGPKAAASLPDWAHLHDVPWRMPIDSPTPEEVLWYGSRDGVRTGVLRDPFMTTFVLEGKGGPEARQAMVSQGNALVSSLQENSLTDYNIWGAVTDGTGRLFLVPANPAEPEPPSEPAQKEKWNPFTDHSKPIADKDYWLVHLGEEQYHLMSWDELEGFGLEKENDPASNYKRPYDHSRPFIPAGRPVLDIKMGMMERRRFVLVGRLDLYEEPYLEARLEKAYELIGLPWEDPRIGKVRESLRSLTGAGEGSSDKEAVASVEGVLASVGGIADVQQLIGLFERISQWGEPQARVFSGLPGGRRDQFTRALESLLTRFAQRESSDEAPPTVRIVPVEEKTGPPDPRFAPAIAMSLNGTLDLTVEVKVWDDQTRYLEVRRSAGGYPAKLASALSVFGVPAQLVMVGGGTTGNLIDSDLKARHIQVAAVPDAPSRVSIMVVRRSGPEVRLVGQGEPVKPEALAQVAEVMRQSMEKELGMEKELARFAEKTGKHRWLGRVPLFVAGERFLSKGEVDLLIQQMAQARELGCFSCVEANRSWNFEVWDKVLETRPEVFITPLETLAVFLNTSPDLLRYRPEILSTRIDVLRRKHGVQEWLVPFRDGSLVIVTGQGAWHALHSPVLRLTYTTGTSDVVTAAYVRARMEQYSAVEAAQIAMTAGAIYMERKEEERGRIPQFQEMWAGRHRTLINILPRFIPPGIAREVKSVTGNSQQMFQRFHQFSLEQIRQQEGPPEDVRPAETNSRFRFLQFLLHTQMPEIVDRLIDNDYSGAYAVAREALRHLDTHEWILRQRAARPPLPADAEYLMPLPAGEGRAYLDWLAQLRQTLQGWMEQFRQAAGPEFQPPPAEPDVLWPLGPGGLPDTGPPSRPPGDVSPRVPAVSANEAPEIIRTAETSDRPAPVIPADKVTRRFTVVDPPTAEGENPPSAGMEEKTAGELFRVLEEGRTGRGVLVIPQQVVDRFPGLAEFLKRLPVAFASDVILWGEGEQLIRLQEANPALKLFQNADPKDLALFLIEFDGAERVGILGDQKAASLLGSLLARFNISVSPVRWNILEIFEILGTPREVSDQLNVEKLLGEFVTESSA